MLLRLRIWEPDSSGLEAQDEEKGLDANMVQCQDTEVYSYSSSKFT